MELLTISHITRLFGITTRTLRYYEHIGLLKSTRKEGYAYRVYDEDAVRRLQQILFLRSLRIPLRQIDALLSDPQAAETTLRAHIENLSQEIDALDSVRRAATALLARTQQAVPHFIPETAEWPEASLLSLSKHTFKEDFSMQDINHANATLSLFDNTRILYLPPATVAASHFTGPDPESAAGGAINRFIVEARLPQRKPDFRLYGFNNPNPTPDSESHGYEFWVTIPENMPVPAPLVKNILKAGFTPHIASKWGTSKNGALSGSGCRITPCTAMCPETRWVWAVPWKNTLMRIRYFNILRRKMCRRQNFPNLTCSSPSN